MRRADGAVEAPRGAVEDSARRGGRGHDHGRVRENADSETRREWGICVGVSGPPVRKPTKEAFGRLRFGRTPYTEHFR